MSSQAPIAASRRRRPTTRKCIRPWSGRSSQRCATVRASPANSCGRETSAGAPMQESRRGGTLELDEIEVRIAYVDRADRAGSSGLHHRALHYLDSRACQFRDHLFEGHASDEAQVQAAGHRHVRPGIELPAPFVQVDLLAAELEREALLGRRAEFFEPHAQDPGIEADAGVPVAGGEDDVIDAVDHFLSNFLRAFSKASCMLLRAASVPFIMSAHASTEAPCSRRSSAIAASRLSRNCSSCFM